MSTIYFFRSIGSKHDVYRGKDYMKKFCEYLRQHAMKIINSENKKTEIIYNRAAGIISKCKSVLYLKRKTWK